MSDKRAKIEALRQEMLELNRISDELEKSRVSLVRPRSDLPQDWQEFGEKYQAIEQQQEGARSKIHKLSIVLHHLTRNTPDPNHATIAAVIAASEDRKNMLRSLLRCLVSWGASEQVIEDQKKELDEHKKLWMMDAIMPHAIKEKWTGADFTPEKYAVEVGVDSHLGRPLHGFKVGQARVEFLLLGEGRFQHLLHKQLMEIHPSGKPSQAAYVAARHLEALKYPGNEHLGPKSLRDLIYRMKNLADKMHGEAYSWAKSEAING